MRVAENEQRPAPSRPAPGAVAHVLLGLLSRQPRHGYELKASFEGLLGSTWPLNISQVYRALARLEDDGMVRSQVVAQELLPDRRVYSITASGRAAVRRWLQSASDSPDRLRDELFIKLLIAAQAGMSETDVLLERERNERFQAIARLTRRRADSGTDVATALVLDGVILRLEADLKWLDVFEQRWRELAR